MEIIKYKIFQTYGFIISLILLISNDLLLKPLFANWLTGKLSDFVGLFVFVLFWSCFYPKYRSFIYLLTAVLFTLWKSPSSEGFIEFLNTSFGLSFQRVVDYTDLIALIILPIAYIYEENLSKKTISIHPILPIALSVFAFIATSYKTEIPINHTYHLVGTNKAKILNKIYMLDGISVDTLVTHPDTIQIFLHSPVCENEFAFRFALNSSEQKSVNITLINGDHRRFCNKKKNSSEHELKEIFEKEFLNKLRRCSMTKKS